MTTKEHPIEDFISCRTGGVVYLLECPCWIQYIGRTKRELWRRLREHVQNIKKGFVKHSLSRHYAEFHNEDPFEWRPFWFVALKNINPIGEETKWLKLASLSQNGYMKYGLWVLWVITLNSTSTVLFWIIFHFLLFFILLYSPPLCSYMLLPCWFFLCYFFFFYAITTRLYPIWFPVLTSFVCVVCFYFLTFTYSVEFFIIITIYPQDGNIGELERVSLLMITFHLWDSIFLPLDVICLLGFKVFLDESPPDGAVLWRFYIG